MLRDRRSPLARFYPDFWDLFDGHVDGGECLEDALRREAREKLGIEVLALKWLGQIYDPVEPAVVHMHAVSSWEGEPDQVGRLVEEEKPHLVLLDLMLPGVDGIELMETVPELSDVPVIFLSAYGMDQIVARVLEAGAVDYNVKPFSPTELVARINTALKRGPPPNRSRRRSPIGRGT